MIGCCDTVVLQRYGGGGVKCVGRGRKTWESM